MLRQVWAGILLGMATIKPQLGLLLPVALVAARQWRALAAAAATVAALVLLSAWAFGLDALRGVLRRPAARLTLEVGTGLALIALAARVLVR